MERKTLYDISWQVSEEEYRADKAYSYSTISKFNREGFDNIGKLFDRVESPSLLFGSMVDSLLTGGQEEFDERMKKDAKTPRSRSNLCDGNCDAHRHFAHDGVGRHLQLGGKQCHF